MQSNNKEIYEVTAERTKKPVELYRALGEVVFTSVYKHLRRPKSLIIKLRGIGTWWLRKRRMEIVLDFFPPDFDKKPEDFLHPLSLIAHENKVEIYNILKERMVEYEEYIKVRNEVRKERWKTQPLIKPNLDKEC